jgi:hypothetical protein
MGLIYVLDPRRLRCDRIRASASGLAEVVEFSDVESLEIGLRS